MTTLASSTPHQSPRSTPSTSSDYEDAAATWEHIEDTRNPAMKRQAAVDWLSEAFARLSLQAERERERERRKLNTSSEDANNTKNGPSKGSKNRETGSSISTVVPTPTIKVTPPDAVEAACAVVVVPATTAATATQGGSVP